MDSKKNKVSWFKVITGWLSLLIIISILFDLNQSAPHDIAQWTQGARDGWLTIMLIVTFFYAMGVAISYNSDND